MFTHCHQSLPLSGLLQDKDVAIAIHCLMVSMLGGGGEMLSQDIAFPP